MAAAPDWLAPATALAAAVLGPLVTIYATGKQSKTTLRVAQDHIAATLRVAQDQIAATLRVSQEVMG